MRKLRENKAITLVALVITIIILLILAGISIAQLTGNGLFEKAKLAKEASKNAQDDEEEKIQQYSNEINSYISGNRNFTAINYSTDEQDTGLKWIDKKTIYQKTFIDLNLSLTWESNKAYCSVSTSPLVTNIENVISATAIVDGTNFRYLNVNTNTSPWKLFTFTGGTIQKITLQYTKTTD